MKRPFSIFVLTALILFLIFRERAFLLQKANAYKPLLEALSALLTPIIAATVAYIAYENYRTGCAKYKADQYDRRIIIYKAIKKFIGRTLALGYPENEDLREYWILVGEADFLFKKDIRDYLQSLFQKGTDLQAKERLLEKEKSDTKREILINERRAIFEWFQAQYDLSLKKFEPYLKL